MKNLPKFASIYSRFLTSRSSYPEANTGCEYRIADFTKTISVEESTMTITAKKVAVPLMMRGATEVLEVAGAHRPAVALRNGDWGLVETAPAR
jgi:hypothetical protein